ncbi:MAG TPA: FG-GAP-like repeat-containing protein [Polyangia bacterium]
MQAIFVSMDDGSLAPTVTPEMVREDLELASQIFAPANIRFEFDPATDVFPPPELNTTVKSTLLSRHCTVTGDACVDAPNIAERNRVAQTYPGKLVVFYAADQSASKDMNGNWHYGQGGPNWSGRQFSFVLMVGCDTCGAGVHPSDSLAHEIGHYLHLDHTMGFGYDPTKPGTILQQAQDQIVKSVEIDGHAKEDAYLLFDGDMLASTPPDPTADMFVAAGLDPCNAAQGTLSLTVNFSDGPYTYSFTPDREDVMDYWNKTCRGGIADISVDQVRAVRTAVDAENRTQLLDARQQYSAVFEPGDSGETRAIGWAFSDFVSRFDQEIAAGRHLAHMQAYDAGGGLLWDGVWDTGSRGTTRAFGWTLTDFATRFNQEIAAGRHLVHMQAYDLGGGQIRYDGVWEDGARGTTRAIGWTLADFATRFDQEIAAGQHLVHMQAYDTGGGQIRYDGVWDSGSQGTTRAIGFAFVDFETRFSQEIAAGKHVVHTQAYDIGGGQIRWDGVWDSGDNGTQFAIAWAFNDFASRNNELLNEGKRLVRFQPYDVGNGLILYDGVWETSTTAQTHVFAEGLSQFAAGFDYQLSHGRHMVQMQSVRAGQSTIATTNLFLHNGSTGATQVWTMRGTSRVSYADLAGYLNLPDSSNWRFVGAGDFNQDGQSDILIHNVNTGAFEIWYMNGATRTGWADFDSYLNLPDSTGWSVVGIADLNHDGTGDVIIHNGASGGTEIWYMNGGARTGYADLDPSLNISDSTGWHLVGTGDFNQDGNFDLVWHNGASGAFSVWYMNGTTRVSIGSLDYRFNFPDAAGWTIISTNDVSFDGRPDIVVRNGATGLVEVWYMNGFGRVDHATFDSYLDFPDSSGWQFVSAR